MNRQSQLYFKSVVPRVENVLTGNHSHQQIEGILGVLTSLANEIKPKRRWEFQNGWRWHLRRWFRIHIKGRANYHTRFEQIEATVDALKNQHNPLDVELYAWFRLLALVANGMYEAGLDASAQAVIEVIRTEREWNPQWIPDDLI